MNVLILADWDHSGAGNALMRAINEHTEHEARQVAYRTSYLDYPIDVHRPTRAVVAELWHWADVVNIHDAAGHLMPWPREHRAQVVTYHGSTYRARWGYYNDVDRGRGRPSTALNLDLAMFGPKWIGRAMPDMGDAPARQHNGAFRVAHAPTNRHIKDTQTVIEAMTDLDGVELVLIEQTSNAECLRLKAGCDLLLEEFRLGYGTNALECWAMGIPVLAHAHPGIENYMTHVLDELPYVDTPLEALRERVVQMREDAAAYADGVRRGREYWQRYHEPATVAAQFIELCEEAMKDGD
jgi:hypothetical protein